MTKVSTPVPRRCRKIAVGGLLPEDQVLVAISHEGMAANDNPMPRHMVVHL
jgi:hypothetical protein